MSDRTVGGTLRAVLPYVVVALLCVGAVVLPSGWNWAIPFLLFATLTIMFLKIDSAELLVLTLPVAFYASLFSMRVNIGLSDLFLIPLIIKVLHSARQKNLGQPILKMASVFLGLMLSLLFVVMLGLIPPLVSGAGVAWPNFLLDSFKLLVSFIYLLTSLLIFSTKIRMRDFAFLRIWQFSATIVAFIGIMGVFLFARGIDLGLTLSYRATSTFEDPNAFALYLIASMGIVMASQFIRRGRVFSWSLVPILVAIYVTYSRGALIAVGISAAVFVILSIGQSRLSVMRWVILAVGFVGGLVILSGKDILQSPRDGSVETDVRFQLWGAAIKVWQDSPLFGAGLGQFRLVSAEYLDTRVSFLAHNTYLSFLAEGGILGLILIVAILGVAVVALLRNLNEVSRILLVSFAGVLTMAATLNLQNSRSMWVFIGIAAAWAVHSRGDRLANSGYPETAEIDLSTDSVLEKTSTPATS